MYGSSSVLRVKIDVGQLAPLPENMFSPNVSNQNCEIAILFTIVQKAYRNGFEVGTTLHSPVARVVSYAPVI